MSKCTRTGPDLEEASDIHAIYGPDSGHGTGPDNKHLVQVYYAMWTIAHSGRTGTYE